MHTIRVSVALAAALWLDHGSARAQSADEPEPTLKASALLDESQLTGAHHSVDEAVATPAFYHVFSLTSPFGRFDAIGRSQVAVRIQEINALAALQEVSRTAVFVKAAGESLVDVGTGVVSAVSDPVGTAKGIGGGVKRLGVNLGRRAKRAADSLRADDDKAKNDTPRDGNMAADAAKSLLGVTSAMRQWARKVGADPYTTNVTLRQALERVAKVDAAGGLVTKVLVPIPPIVSTTAKVGDLVWGQDPEELRKLNEARAKEIGAPEDGARAFFRSRAFTLTLQTRLMAALHAVHVPGCGDYLASAAEATDEREALFFIESAEMLLALHEASPVAAVLTDSRAMVAKRPAGAAVTLLPFDWVRRGDGLTTELRPVASRAKEELGATSLTLRVSGHVTDAAWQSLAQLGWTR